MPTQTAQQKQSGQPHYLAEYVSDFNRLGGDSKLAALWSIYDGIGEHRIANPDENQAEDNASDLYATLSQKPQAEQLQFMRDVLAEKPGNSSQSTDSIDEYNRLSNTSKIALWYRLGQGMEKNSVVQVPSDYELSEAAKSLVKRLNAIDFEQKYIFMRDVLLG